MRSAFAVPFQPEIDQRPFDSGVEGRRRYVVQVVRAEITEQKIIEVHRTSTRPWLRRIKSEHWTSGRRRPRRPIAQQKIGDASQEAPPVEVGAKRCRQSPSGRKSGIRLNRCSVMAIKN